MWVAGVASAFAAQFLIQAYVVPHAEARRRRLERREKDVLDLGELLTTAISDLAGEAQSAQLYVRWTVKMVGSPDFDQAAVERELSQRKVAARDATRRFHDQVNYRSDWIMGRIIRYRVSDKVVEFTQASYLYRLHLLKPAPDEWMELSEPDFDAWWKAERERRTTLTSRVKALAFDPRPLRRSWRLRLQMLKNMPARCMHAFRRKSIETRLAAAEAEQKHV